ARRFWVTYRQDWAALRVHFPKDVDPSDRNLLQMLATETQLVRPEGAGAQWTALERDGAGLYLAIYQWTGPERIVKRKLKYVDRAGAGGDQPPGAVQVAMEASERVFTVDAGGALLAFDGTDHLRVGLPMGQGDPALSERLVALFRQRPETIP